MWLSSKNCSSLILGIAVLLSVGGAACTIVWVDSGRVNQGVHAMGIDLSGHTQTTARARLWERFERYASEPLTLRYLGREWTAMPFEVGLTFDADRTAASALAVGREGNSVQRLLGQLTNWGNGNASVQPLLAVETVREKAFLGSLARQIDQAPLDARLVVQPDLRVGLVPSRVGRKVETAELAERLRKALLTLSGGSVDIPVEETPPRIVEAAVQQARADAGKMLSASILLNYEGRNWVLRPEDIRSMLVFNEEANAQDEIALVADLSDEKVRSFLKLISRDIDRKPRDARFDYNGGRPTVLQESVDGRQLEIDASVELIRAQAKTDRRVIALPVSIVRPAVASSDAGKLGVKDMIDSATTSYAGSIPEREHNVELAAQRLNGLSSPQARSSPSTASLARPLWTLVSRRPGESSFATGTR